MVGVVARAIPTTATTAWGTLLLSARVNLGISKQCVCFPDVYDVVHDIVCDIVYDIVEIVVEIVLRYY